MVCNQEHAGSVNRGSEIVYWNASMLAERRLGDFPLVGV